LFYLVSVRGSDDWQRSTLLHDVMFNRGRNQTTPFSGRPGTLRASPTRLCRLTYDVHWVVVEHGAGIPLHATRCRSFPVRSFHRFRRSVFHFIVTSTSFLPSLPISAVHSLGLDRAALDLV